MSRILVRAALTAALATTLTAGVSSAAFAPTATAAPSTRSVDCVETGHADHAGSSARVAPGHGSGRADTREVSPAEQRQIDQSTRAILKKKRQQQSRSLAAGNSIASIPVYVHVMIGNGNAGNVTDSQITRQISVLNQTYGGADVNGAGLNTGVGFYLAGTDRYVNNSWHQDKQSSTYRAKTRLGGKNALNIWLVDFSYLGVATFPWDYAKQPKIDGIRVQYSSLPGGSATNYNLGETATHEAGHWLGLYHTFQGGCADPGDSVSDTPAQASPSTGCPTGRDSCTAPGTDPIHNYMDYSYDSCYTTFSAGQDSRIDQMWAAYRA
ncbi:Pregnancy-associated plasma protein-A [Nocardioides scoriae]|uniref:Pregnancy-associated plasma protein-A n=1 Tax=Nocardioides scoriae TaxID=642780 RepID=A0A1H1L316_9ACTN|nr:zinc metalloprotease [Nocardioides scoriae]SDR68672.1 Pregnancy-associated plasma protein-A [Nocardioides scoriae]